VDRDERTGGPRGQAVERLGDELLARAALARDEDRRAGRGRLADRLENPLHLRGAPDELAHAARRVELGPQGAVLGDEAALLERLLDDVDDLLVPEGLRDVMEGSLAHRGDRALDRRVRRHDDDGDLRMARLDVGEDLESRAIREHEIQEQDVDLVLLQAGKPVRRRRGLAGRVTRLREDGAEDIADDGLVVEDEDCCHGFQLAAGSKTVKRAPCAPDVAVSVPPCDRMISRAIERPRPVPPCAVFVE
jgi:hypothetical protein